MEERVVTSKQAEELETWAGVQAQGAPGLSEPHAVSVLQILMYNTEPAGVNLSRIPAGLGLLILHPLSPAAQLPTVGRVSELRDAGLV